jgi:putative sigma-54 modulation protein
MKRVLRTNPNVARIADRTAAAIVATVHRAKCTLLFVLSVGLRLRFPLSRWKEDRYIAWNAIKNKKKLLTKLSITAGFSNPAFLLSKHRDVLFVCPRANKKNVPVFAVSASTIFLSAGFYFFCVEYIYNNREGSGPMRFDIRGKNIELTDALKDYTTKRLSKLGKYIDNVKEAQVALSVEGEGHKVEVTIPLNGMILRGEELSEDMYSSIDLVEEKLEKQIEKYRTRLYHNNRGVGLKKNGIHEKENNDDADTDSFKVVRTKRFALKPMDEEEAIMQMNLLGHNFFVFFNAKDEEVNVVYRRKDGNYGLIEPRFD